MLCRFVDIDEFGCLRIGTNVVPIRSWRRIKMSTRLAICESICYLCIQRLCSILDFAVVFTFDIDLDISLTFDLGLGVIHPLAELLLEVERLEPLLVVVDAAHLEEEAVSLGHLLDLVAVLAQQRHLLRCRDELQQLQAECNNTMTS